MAVEPQLYYADPDVALCSARNVFVVIWRVNTTVAAVQRVDQTCEQFAAAHPDGIGHVTIVEQSAPMPPNDARDRLALYLRESTHIKASAVAFEGTGFRAAAVRSVVAGLALIARQPFPHKIFPTLETASDWLIPELKLHVPSVDYGADEFIREVQRVRLQVEVKSPSKREASA